MAEITINGVKYTNVPNKKAGTKFAASLTQSNIGASQAVQDYVNSSYFYPLVNAIDINWNGVEVDENSYINSTSDLITYIATKGSNVDLTSYATKSYVDQKIEDVVGGAPETLDTLKELADALANDATLAYVTEALDGKADKSSLDDYATIAYVTTELDKKADLNDIPDMTNYATQSDVNSAFGSLQDIVEHDYATISYVTEELDKKVDISDMPVIPDMSSYVTTNTDQTISGGKTFTNWLYIKKNESCIRFTNTSNQILGDIYVTTNYNIGSRVSAVTINPMNNSYFLFNQNNYDLIVPKGDVVNNANIINSNKHFYMPLVFKDNSNNIIRANNAGIVDLSSIIPSAPDLTPYATVSYVTTELENKADASDIPDMTNYVDVTSYNALYTEVQRLAYLISYYHPSSPDPGPGTQFEGYWTLDGVRIDSITLSESDSPVTLSFVSNPTLASGIGTWTFYDVDPNVTINTSTGEMTINPSLIGGGTVYSSNVGYLYENGYYSTSFNMTITITSASKSPATGYFVDGSNNFINTPLAWSDEGGELDEQAFTLVSDPASGWTGPVVSYTSNELHSGQDYTISGNTITFGNIQSPPNVSTFAWSYAGDSSYNDGSVELKVVGLQYGADTQFFPDCGNSSTIQIPAGTDVFGFNIINRTGIDYLQHPISVSSDNQNVTVTNGITADSFTITNTSTGTSQSATITATITEGNDTHTTSFSIEFLPSQPTQEYTNVSVNYDVPNTQATDLPQGTFDTNPFEVGNTSGVGMGSSLIAKVEFSGSEYDMNNFNTDFVLTRDTSYTGNYSQVYKPQYPDISISNTYSNGVNTITFLINIYAAGSESGTNRDLLTFTHNGYTYLTDGIKTHVEAGAPT